MKNILFIHQSADLYGSDKTLLYLVDAIKNDFNPIVVLPEEGPLTEELNKINIEVIISPVIKVSRQLFTSLQIIKLPFLMYSAVTALKKTLGNRKIDIVHSNTLAVFLGALYSHKYKIKHVWHVHEIIKHPKIVSKAYPYLVNYFSSFVVFNSQASFNHLCEYHPKLKKKSQIIYNGLDRNLSFITEAEQNALRKSFFNELEPSTLIIGLIGRINKHKGQHLLLNAFEELLLGNNIKNIKLLFIGSTIKKQEHLLIELEKAILEKGIKEHVTVIDFQKDLWKYYDCIDIVIVPTTDPEPFGLVAVEAMLSKKPVIAANHGGLKEIVLHNNTGLLFEPSNKIALKNAIEKLILNPELITLYGNQGYTRSKLEFSLLKYTNSFKTFYHSI
ncbi:glycosyltransferase family 4 protein [Mariniflexile jejuense]|uniref:Glycosyltransferase family 4 protein n=1 Tax=Mariniflexile jejuense TaxID=1173582 RepID=A0ABW3JKX9_9FLAO